MIFLSFWFIAFALVFFPGYYLARWPGLRLAVLAASCVVFQATFAGPAGVLPIIGLATLTYGCALSGRKNLRAAGPGGGWRACSRGCRRSPEP